MTVPLAFVSLGISNNVELLGIVYVALEIVSAIFRLPIVKKSTGLDVPSFLKNVLIKSLLPIIVLVGLCWLLTITTNMAYRFLLTFTLPVLVYAMMVYFSGLTQDEKLIVERIIRKIKR